MNAHAPYLIQGAHPASPSLAFTALRSVRATCALSLVLSVSLAYTVKTCPQVAARPNKPRAQVAPPVEFTLISLERPLLRRGKRLTTPRRVVLFASRLPMPAELDLSQGGRPWVGSTLQIFRASPIKVNPQEVAEQEARLIERYRALTRGHVKSHYQALNDEAARFSRERVKPVVRGGASAPSVSSLGQRGAEEREEDDDELSSAPVEPAPSAEARSVELPVSVPPEGQLCGGEGQPCCEQGFDEPCSAGLTCLTERSQQEGQAEERWRCTPPPDPCGGYAEPCCANAELTCLFEGLVCTESAGAEGMCVMPPLPAPERRLLVGSLKVLNVRGRFVEAEVTADRLVGLGNHAVMKGDKALFKSVR